MRRSASLRAMQNRPRRLGVPFFQIPTVPNLHNVAHAGTLWIGRELGSLRMAGSRLMSDGAGAVARRRSCLDRPKKILPILSSETAVTVRFEGGLHVGGVRRRSVAPHCYAQCVTRVATR